MGKDSAIAIAAGLLAFAAQAGHVATQVSEDCASMGSVTAVDKDFMVGAKVSIKATARTGYAFAGWYLDDKEAAETLTDWRNPSTTWLATEGDATLVARFVKESEDALAFDFSSFLEGDAFPVNGPLTNGVLAIASAAFPQLKLAGLPTGLKLDASTLKITGAPAKPGIYVVKAEATNASKYSLTRFYRMIVGNISSERMQGVDSLAYVGDEFYDDIHDYFAIDESVAECSSVTVSGLPVGLKLVKETEGGETSWTIQGTPTRPGDFVVTATVTFKDGVKESATAIMSIEVDTIGYGVDFSALEGCVEGDFAGDKDDGVWLGDYDSDEKTGLTSISGLPNGLSIVKEANEDGSISYLAKGMFEKAGTYNVTAKVAYLDDNLKIKTLSLVKTITVQGSPSVYLAASVTDAENVPGCTVLGEGVYNYGAKVTVRAIASKNFVFAGWYDAGGETIDAVGDYREPSKTFKLAPGSELSWNAAFVSKDMDGEIEFNGLDGSELSIDASSEFVEEFGVRSVSATTLTATGLLSGFSLQAGEVAGTYRFVYDPLVAKGSLKPGYYVMTVTAKNASACTAVARFSVVVDNWRSDRIDLADELGSFDPGKPIDPIDLSGAINFEGGDTWTVASLPKGLTYNAKANATTGVAAYTITGTPTVPGIYTAMFSAKVVVSAVTNQAGRVTNTYANEKATATIIVNPFPSLEASIDEEMEAAGCSVTGTGGYMPGTKVTLKAIPAKGCVFAGWDGPDGSALSLLNPSLTVVTDDIDTTYSANFIKISDDWLAVDEYDSGLDGDESPATLKLDVNADLGNATNAVAELIDSGSLPSVSVSGLPAGMKFDPKTLMLSGKPTKAGVFYATVTAKNAGGYAFTRILRIMVRNADGSDSTEAEEVNTANVYLSDLDDLATGEAVSIGIEIPEYEDGDDVNAVKSVSVSGLPKGLSSSLAFDGEGLATVTISGVPSVAMRATVKIAVTYAGNKRAEAVHSVIVRDSGSAYLFVDSSDTLLGSVVGEGVYAAGAPVKLTAKAARNCVFAGWWSASVGGDDEEVAEDAPFAAASADYRTPNLTFLMTVDLAGAHILGDFVSAVDDKSIGFVGMDEEWDIIPDDDSELAIVVDSASLPTVTVSGLPKGVVFDKSASVLSYSAANKAKLAPGVYSVAINAQNASGAKAETFHATVRIPVPENDFFSGYALDQGDGYFVQAGMNVADGLASVVDLANELQASGLAVTFKNLPSGVSITKDTLSTSETYGLFVARGAPSKAGTFVVTITASGTVDGKSVRESGMFFITATPVPGSLVGTFNGDVHVDDPYDNESETPRKVAVGTFTATAAATGKITVKIARPTGTFNFSAASWDSVSEEDGIAMVTLRDTSGRTVELAVCLDGSASQYQATATFHEKADLSFLCRAQRNSFEAGDEEALVAVSGITGTYLFRAKGSEDAPGGVVYSYELDDKLTPSAAALSMVVDAKGSAKFAGKYGAKSISGSTVLILGSNEAGAPTMTAELVVKNDSRSVAIVKVAFTYNAEQDVWSMDAIGGEVAGAMVEVFCMDRQ